jgi:hypothetical protein
MLFCFHVSFVITLKYTRKTATLTRILFIFIFFHLCSDNYNIKPEPIVYNNHIIFLNRLFIYLKVKKL